MHLVIFFTQYKITTKKTLVVSGVKSDFLNRKRFSRKKTFSASAKRFSHLQTFSLALQPRQFSKRFPPQSSSSSAQLSWTENTCVGSRHVTHVSRNRNRVFGFTTLHLSPFPRQCYELTTLTTLDTCCVLSGWVCGGSCAPP